jgi:predicted AlkP superfamily pyrophosphatase or phosphodiesterase
VSLRFRPLVLAVVAVALLLACRTGSLAPERAILILVSIDGFRWDYLDRFRPPTLMALANDGVRADGLIPQFPSKTFPNHYTIVTGLRLASHGIISNNMTDPAIPGRFSLSNRRVLADPRWWGGEPIWNTAERQGHITGALFWPGSETRIGGRQATYWMPYDERMPNDVHVAKSLEWLAQPEEKRPSFLTVYFSDVDHEGHEYGPESPQVRDAVADVDVALQQLVNGVRSLGLADRVHYIVVSDHGMSQLSPERVIVLDDFVDLDTVDVVDWSPVVTLSPNDGNVEALYAALKDRHPSLAVYRSADLPAKYGLAGHPRLPPVIGIADDGWAIMSRQDLERWKSSRRVAGGAHGYDPQLRNMHGLFVAAGPRLQHGIRVPAFENIHVYELMCALLGIEPAKNDGDPDVTKDMLRSVKAPGQRTSRFEMRGRVGD